MKKYIVALVAVLALAVSGCGVNSNPTIDELAEAVCTSKPVRDPGVIMADSVSCGDTYLYVFETKEMRDLWVKNSNDLGWSDFTAGELWGAEGSTETLNTLAKEFDGKVNPKN